VSGVTYKVNSPSPRRGEKRNRGGKGTEGSHGNGGRCASFDFMGDGYP